MLPKAQYLTTIAIIRDSLPGCCTAENIFIFTILKISLFGGECWLALRCSLCKTLIKVTS